MEWRLPKNLPDEDHGWFLGIIKPRNFQKLDIKKLSYLQWMLDFGLEKIWYNQGLFWSHTYRSEIPEELNDRLLCWCELPDLKEDIISFYEPPKAKELD